MTVFLSIAGMMVLVAMAWLLPTLLRRREGGAQSTPAASNLAILRDQLAELERDVARGVLSPENVQQARDEINRRVLEESAEAPTPQVLERHARGTAIALSCIVPVLAGLFYWQLGTPAGLDAKVVTASHAEKFSPQQVEEMVNKLAARLEQSPDDGNGWALLGRSYIVMQRYDDAAKAYGKAVAQIKDSADLYADYADALAMTQGRRIEGESLKLIEKALKIDPGHWKALAMAGSAAFDRKDYKTAVGYWETLLARLGPETEFSKSVASNIAEARELGGIKAAAAPAQKQAPAVAAAAQAAVVRGNVSLSPSLAAKAAPEDTVFVFARAANGPRMPLALVRKQVKDLPFTFVLDDSQSMSPEMKLSKFSEIVVGARVSKTAGATPQPGDLQGFTQKIRTGGAAVTVVIDQIVP